MQKFNKKYTPLLVYLIVAALSLLAIFSDFAGKTTSNECSKEDCRVLMAHFGISAISAFFWAAIIFTLCYYDKILLAWLCLLSPILFMAFLYIFLFSAIYSIAIFTPPLQNKQRNC
jgi:hypothetical protein